jgi:hypothetical protein
VAISPKHLSKRPKAKKYIHPKMGLVLFWAY